MKKLLITLVCVCIGLTALSAPNSDAITLTEQLNVKPLTGYVQLGDVDADGWVPVEYVGTENVNITVTVNGSPVSIVNKRFKLPGYGTYVVVVTVKATGYATLTVTFNDVTWEQDPHSDGYWIVLLDRFGNKVWYELFTINACDYLESLNVYSSLFGNGDTRFCFLMNSITYGATYQDAHIVLGDNSQNLLIEYSSLDDPDLCYYIVPSGYSYLLGIHISYNLDYEVIGQNASVVRLGPVVDPSYLRGDVDGDEAVTIADVTSLIDYLLTSTTQIDQYNADIDDDGRIGINDVTELIDMLLH